jgi:O-succinylbenzoic acid--CoA ligase
VERVLTAQPGVRAACVVGLPDPEWGQSVAAAIVLDDTVLGHTVPDHTVPDHTGGDQVAWAAAVRAELGAPAVPRRLRVLDALPLRGVGKPDRAEVARLLADMLPR